MYAARTLYARPGALRSHVRPPAGPRSGAPRPRVVRAHLRPVPHGDLAHHETVGRGAVPEGGSGGCPSAPRGGARPLQVARRPWRSRARGRRPRCGGRCRVAGHDGASGARCHRHGPSGHAGADRAHPGRGPSRLPRDRPERMPVRSPDHLVPRARRAARGRRSGGSGGLPRRAPAPGRRRGVHTPARPRDRGRRPSWCATATTARPTS